MAGARRSGVPPTLQFLFDQSDLLMPPPFELAAWGNVKGLSVDLTMTVGSFSKTISSPGILEAPVDALADDVLFYRQQAILFSNQRDLKSLARAYRTYLQVCISLVDAFLGHAAFGLKNIDPKSARSENYNALTSPTSFSNRLDAWFEICRNSSSIYRQTKCWSDLEKLRQERNRYVHPVEPIYSLGLDEIVNVLNRCRDGVGGTLEHLREIAGVDPRLAFIQKVKTAPMIKKVK